jgi:type IV pilus assembly protein PilV
MQLRAPRATSKSNEGGFTLLELVVAVVILMVGLLGMLQAIGLSIKTNLQNELRTKGMMIGEDQMARIKSLPFDNITATGTGEKTISVPASMRSSVVNFTVTKKIETISTQAKKIDVYVWCLHQGNKYEHVVSSVVTQPVTK